LNLEGQLMRTNIEIDDALMREAMEAAGTSTKKATVEAGLRMLIATGSQAGMRQLRGRVKWEGDLDVSRRGRMKE
jgi:Arc/MetJ family transcription regulator